MALGNFFKSVFGGGSDEAKVADPVAYKEFTIEAAPVDENGKFRTAGYISGELDGEIKRIRFIRADQSVSLDAAIEHATNKARQIIDEQGEELLKKAQL